MNKVLRTIFALTLLAIAALPLLAADITGFRASSGGSSTNVFCATNMPATLLADPNAIALRIWNRSGISTVAVDAASSISSNNAYQLLAPGASITFDTGGFIPQQNLYVVPVDNGTNGNSGVSTNQIRATFWDK